MIIPSSRNPRVASSINPFVASSLNPRIASSLNPCIASSKNPFVASSLNPRVASSINPRVTSSLNYRVASSINPSVSSSLNPRVASSINPNISSNIPGLYVFNLDLDPVGFTVTASDRVTLLFTPASDFTGILVAAREDFWNEFDLSNELDTRTRRHLAAVRPRQRVDRVNKLMPNNSLKPTPQSGAA
jgi:hypothetical protein